eukprot:CAMPEP_0119054958 /NCGR_PEP_ID=MMETSP1177-20130426/75419_1 /TAXON_ID=2985 /ORGANISM="Ochromonas sp, Strain CCMP1899" /LENGTH=150 /DNA_ID=CAMNT_0007035373 /DNA_START=90 /DNA_END=542 /DNA_ORIENTATION=+
MLHIDLMMPVHSTAVPNISSIVGPAVSIGVGTTGLRGEDSDTDINPVLAKLIPDKPDLSKLVLDATRLNDAPVLSKSDLDTPTPVPDKSDPDTPVPSKSDLDTPVSDKSGFKKLDLTESGFDKPGSEPNKPELDASRAFISGFASISELE